MLQADPQHSCERHPGVYSNPDMMGLPSGTSCLGSDRRHLTEAPAHRVSVDGFWIDRAPVSNREFRKFVCATDYVTFAEKQPDRKALPYQREEEP